MKTSVEEKNFIDKVSAISGYDSKIVKELFNSVFIIVVREIYAQYYNKSEEIKIDLPFLFKFILNYEKIPDPDKNTFILKEEFDVKINDHLHKALLNIVNENETEIEGLIVKEISKVISNVLN